MDSTISGKSPVQGIFPEKKVEIETGHSENFVTEALLRARHILKLIDDLETASDAVAQSLVYYISLDRVESLDNLTMFGDTLFVNGLFRLSLRIAATDTDRKIALRDKWLVDVLPLMLLRSPEVIDQIVREIWSFNFSALECMHGNENMSQFSCWKNLFHCTGELLGYLDSPVQSSIFREVDMGAAQIEVWKGLNSYYLPLIQEIMNSGAGETRNIRVQILNLETFSMQDALSKVRISGNIEDWLKADGETFNDLLVPVKMKISVRTIGEASLQEHVERVFSLGDPLLKLKAFMGLVLNYRDLTSGDMH
ncbi:MAG: hypothetical protein CVV64_04715 [Candidatus Wallbacteria bacterium HGW-Wallbacteria-1]|jgi:hypothetical protein|uniref:Uncharacterized protein n=1 Tax=Candidatus Wallbacteria bacterium HGW-Wallbacteria-1 TaxID=2013854 RepID=A0A2N1PRV3_9BACT|nr:MAG: hypothetical protein CVV64_04715 [Candidatus Wallbacteria bacterium HGW-Wallbacteria-1]